MVDVVANGGDQLFQVLEDAAADLVRSQIAEMRPTLNSEI